jgi:hypothetical protein
MQYKAKSGVPIYYKVHYVNKMSQATLYVAGMQDLYDFVSN